MAPRPKFSLAVCREATARGGAMRSSQSVTAAALPESMDVPLAETADEAWCVDAGCSGKRSSLISRSRACPPTTGHPSRGCVLRISDHASKIRSYTRIALRRDWSTPGSESGPDNVQCESPVAYVSKHKTRGASSTAIVRALLAAPPLDGRVWQIDFLPPLSMSPFSPQHRASLTVCSEEVDYHVGGDSAVVPGHSKQQLRRVVAQRVPDRQF
eukprot:scaffold30241_cov28-Tisochrysis_lutea.AAC.12